MPSAETGPDQEHALEGALTHWVLPLPGIDRLIALHPYRPSQALLLSSLHHRLAIRFAASHDRPHHARHLVRQRDGRDLGRSARHQLDQPWPTRAVALGVSDNRHRAEHEHLA